MKIRHVDYYPDEFLNGTANMSNELAGAYWRICSLIYSNGGPIEDDAAEIAPRLKTTARGWKRLRDDLLQRRKLSLIDGRLSNARAAVEIERSSKRVQQSREAGKQGGRPRGKSGTSPNRPGMHVGSVPGPTADGQAMDAGNSTPSSAENNGLPKAAVLFRKSQLTN